MACIKVSRELGRPLDWVAAFNDRMEAFRLEHTKEECDAHARAILSERFRLVEEPDSPEWLAKQQRRRWR